MTPRKTRASRTTPLQHRGRNADSVQAATPQIGDTSICVPTARFRWNPFLPAYAVQKFSWLRCPVFRRSGLAKSRPRPLPITTKINRIVVLFLSQYFSKTRPAWQAEQARLTAKEKQGAPAGERPALYNNRQRLFSDEARPVGCVFLFVLGGDPSLPAPALLLHGPDLLFEVEGLLHRPVDRQQGGGQGQPDVAQDQ